MSQWRPPHYSSTSLRAKADHFPPDEENTCQRHSHKTFYRRLLPIVKLDPCSAYILLAYSAAYRASLRPLQDFVDRSNDNVLALEYKDKCLEILNARACEDSKGRLMQGDLDIQRSLLLFALECRFGTFDDFDKHAVGLQDMVRGRGGESCRSPCTHLSHCVSRAGVALSKPSPIFAQQVY